MSEPVSLSWRHCANSAVPWQAHVREDGPGCMPVPTVSRTCRSVVVGALHEMDSPPLPLPAPRPSRAAAAAVACPRCDRADLSGGTLAPVTLVGWTKLRQHKQNILVTLV